MPAHTPSTLGTTPSPCSPPTRAGHSSLCGPRGLAALAGTDVAQSLEFSAINRIGDSVAQRAGILRRHRSPVPRLQCPVLASCIPQSVDYFDLVAIYAIYAFARPYLTCTGMRSEPSLGCARGYSGPLPDAGAKSSTGCFR